MSDERKAGPNNPLVKEVFKSTDGHKFYSLLNPLEISAKRALSAEEAKRYAEMCITKKEMNALLQEYANGVNRQDILYSHSIVQEIRYRLKMFCEENSAFDLACLYYFIEGEDINEPHESFMNLKRQLYQSDEMVRGFFLPISISLLKEFGQKVGDDTLTYLAEIKDLTSRIYRYIPPSTWTSTENTSTN